MNALGSLLSAASRSRRYSAVALLLLGQLGCVGNLGEPDGTWPDDGSGGPGTVVPPPGVEPPKAIPQASECKTNLPGPRLLRRLSVEQYEATLADLFGDANFPKSSVFDDPVALGFKVDAEGLTVSGDGAFRVQLHADEIAAWAVEKLPTLSSCQTHDPACQQQFIREFGRRAFRAPVTDAQVQAYQAIMAAEPTFEDGAKVVMSAMLQSPYFLYRRELGAPDPANPSIYKLDQHEIASSLSYMITGSMPDAMLLAAADAGMLATPEQINAQGQRLLQDPRAKTELISFLRGWLRLNRLKDTVKDDTVFMLTDTLKHEMLGETDALISDMVFAQNGSFADLLTADYSFLDGTMAQHYGLSGGGEDPIKVTYNPGQRDPGLLAHATFLAGHSRESWSSPTQRGRTIREQLLCQPVEDPPPGVDPNPKAEGFKTTRERYKAHSDNKYCFGCHKYMDPIGLAFENYDAFGRWRSDENGIAVDASGTIHEVDGVKEGGNDVAFNGVTELVDYLASSDEVKECMVRFWSYYSYGAAKWDQDGCTYDAVRTAAAAGNFSMQSVWLALASAPHFTSRVQGP